MVDEVKKEGTALAEATVKTRAEFDALLANAKGPVLVDFIQPDCGPCIEETPAFNKLAEACKTSAATIMRVDVTQGFGAELGAELDISGTPTGLLADSADDFKAGRVREVADLESSSVRRKLKCAVPSK